MEGAYQKRVWGRGKTRKEVPSTSCLSGVLTTGGDAYILPFNVPLCLMTLTLNPVTCSLTNPESETCEPPQVWYLAALGIWL